MSTNNPTITILLLNVSVMMPHMVEHKICELLLLKEPKTLAIGYHLVLLLKLMFEQRHWFFTSEKILTGSLFTWLPTLIHSPSIFISLLVWEEQWADMMRKKWCCGSLLGSSHEGEHRIVSWGYSSLRGAMNRHWCSFSCSFNQESRLSLVHYRRNLSTRCTDHFPIILAKARVSVLLCGQCG